MEPDLTLNPDPKDRPPRGSQPLPRWRFINSLPPTGIQKVADNHQSGAQYGAPTSSTCKVHQFF